MSYLVFVTCQKSWKFENIPTHNHRKKQNKKMQRWLLRVWSELTHILGAKNGNDKNHKEKLLDFFHKT
jgi:hypothetical protein